MSLFGDNPFRNPQPLPEKKMDPVDPKELKELIQDLKNIPLILGSSKKTPTKNEIINIENNIKIVQALNLLIFRF